MTIVTCRWPRVATPGTITTPINNIKYLFRGNLDNISSINNTGCPKKKSTIKQTKMAKHGRLVSIPKWSKRVRNAKPRCF